jgi:hypothetical protein
MIDCVLQSYRDFVALCARQEHETGQPCLIPNDQSLTSLPRRGMSFI